jgi:hypothetical protein
VGRLSGGPGNGCTLADAVSVVNVIRDVARSEEMTNVCFTLDHFRPIGKAVNSSLLFLVPQVREERYRGWTMSSVVAVRISEDFQVS